MSIIRILVAGTALLIAVGTADAATVSGRITRIDPKTDAITLSDGKTFVLPEGVEAESLKVGESVEVTYSGKGTHLNASQVRVAK